MLWQSSFLEMHRLDIISKHGVLKCKAVAIITSSGDSIFILSW